MIRSMPDVRPSSLAGTWYPGDRKALLTMLEGYLNNTERLPDADPSVGPIVGLLAPHAGYKYSGGTAAKAFAQVQGRAFDTVVILGPLHRPMSGITGTPLTTAHAAYGTPLGTVEVDRDILNDLKAAIAITTVRNDPEHSIEIELPFLQAVLKPGFRVVPLMLVSQSQMKPVSHALIDVLKDLKDRKVLIVASSDLSHFNTQAVANELDQTMLAAVEAMDSDRVIEVQHNHLGYACGYGAIAAAIDVIAALYDNPRATLTGYATSGDIGESYSSVVGYGSAVFTGRSKV